MATWGFRVDGQITPNNNNDNSNNHFSRDDTTATDDLDYFGPLADPEIQDLLVNGTIPYGYSFSPLPSLPSSGSSFFATVGNTQLSPYYTTPNTTDVPSLHVNGTFHLTPTRNHPALSPHGDHSSLGLPGQPISRSGGYHSPHDAPRNQQIRSPQGSNQNSHYHSATPSSSSWGPALPLPYMNNANLCPTPVSRAQSFSRATLTTRTSDDSYLDALATQNFSSPSIPPLSSPAPPRATSPSGLSKLAAAGQEMPQSSTRRRGPSRGGAVDLAKEEPDLGAPAFGIDLSIPVVRMPPTTRRQSLAGGNDSTVRKRRSSPLSPSGRPNKSRRKEGSLFDDGSNPFDEEDATHLLGQDLVETIDLSNATEVPAEHMAPKVDNRVKLGKFQCVICMDDTAGLTVTHCGHLFCSECLHSSLHIDSSKRTCPVCRSKVDLKDKKGKTLKSFYHLELKIMTATKKGKRPAGT